MSREPPPAAVEEAKHKPNGWVYEIVGGEDPDGSVPPERIRGAWRVNADGVIIGGFVPTRDSATRPDKPSRHASFAALAAS